MQNPLITIKQLNDAESYISKPVRYDKESQNIYGNDDSLILNVRGWARLSRKKNGAELQDSIGEYLAFAINSMNERVLQLTNMAVKVTEMQGKIDDIPKLLNIIPNQQTLNDGRLQSPG